MDKTSDIEQTYKLGKSAIFAKFENLYVTVDEMYKNGSKQSFMTLNIQFMLSQLIAVLKDTSNDFSDVHIDIKEQIEKHAKAFYANYSAKGFYLIENQIGLIYCLITLISLNMVSSSTGLKILTSLSMIDNKNSFQNRQNALNSLKTENKTINVDNTNTSAELFAPDKNSISSFHSMIENIPKVLKPTLKKINLQEEKNKKNALKITENFPNQLERIVLKSTPFEGDFHLYYKTLIQSHKANIPGGKRKHEREQVKNKITKKPEGTEKVNDLNPLLTCLEKNEEAIKIEKDSENPKKIERKTSEADQGQNKMKDKSKHDKKKC